MKFTEPTPVKALLSNPNHNIEGIHVSMRPFHIEQKSNTNHYDQIMQENLTLKYEIANLQKSLSEAQNYSKTAYETFQALREKYGKTFLSGPEGSSTNKILEESDHSSHRMIKK